MITPPNIPNNANGAVLRRLWDSGDDLSQPRIIEFFHSFVTRRQALDFAELVDDRQLEVCISYNEEENKWDAIVKRYMIPTHHDISDQELLLARHAESVDGRADGWECMRLVATKSVMDG